MRFWALLCIAAVVLNPFSRADQVKLTNGDRLTGAVVKSDGKTLTMKTALTGTVEIPWSSIETLEADPPLVVTVAGAPSGVTGSVKATDKTITVTPSAGEAEVAALSALMAVRTPAEQAKYERSLHPPFSRGWKVGVDLGYDLTEGNSETSSLTLAFNAVRPTPTDKVSLYANSVYATDRAEVASHRVTANTTHAGVRYERNLTPRVFVYGAGDFDRNALQDLNLRSVGGGGLGFRVIKNDRTTLDLFGGPAYTHENYVTFTRDFTAMTIGDEFTHKMGSAILFTQKFSYFPDLSHTGEYRTVFDAGLIVKLNRWLGWQTSFGDIYVTNPPVGKKRNDVVFTTGLNLAFAH